MTLKLPASEIQCFDNILVVPYKHGAPKKPGITSIGVFDSLGQSVPNCEMGTQSRQSSSDINLFKESISKADHVDGNWLFCGLNSGQFGHVITRGIGRLWAHQFLPEGTKLAFAAHHLNNSQDQMINSITSLLKVATPQLSVQRPTIFERMHVAPDLFSEILKGIADPAYADWFKNQLTLGNRTGRRIYVTRSSLGPRHGRVLCEDILEQNLTTAGFEIVSPEKLSLKDQIQTYHEADVIIAMESSALHVIPLILDNEAQLIVIQRRPDVPILIRNQIDSFSNSHVDYINCLHREYWPEIRADNSCIVELDFDQLRSELITAGVLKITDEWIVPSNKQLKESLYLGQQDNVVFMNIEQRKNFLKKIRTRRRKQSLQNEMNEQMIKIDGLRYIRLLKRIHMLHKPNWYLEVGTFSGKSLQLAECNIVSVDPNFKISNPVINSTGQQMHFFQKTSDDFFALPFLKDNKIKFDFAFLDGLHHFEVLLRDFINTEKHMSKRGIITLHDCCPSTQKMAEREFHTGYWTGDVWKTLLILLKYRPDLDIQVTNAAPTGLVVISNLSPKNSILENVYDEVISNYLNMELVDLPKGIHSLYENFELKPAASVLSHLQNKKIEK